MQKDDLIQLQLTPEEAKAALRLIASCIAHIKSDPEPVSNEITLQKAIAASERVAEKIKEAVADAGFPLE